MKPKVLLTRPSVVRTRKVVSASGRQFGWASTLIVTSRNVPEGKRLQHQPPEIPARIEFDPIGHFPSPPPWISPKTNGKRKARSALEPNPTVSTGDSERYRQ